MTHSILLAEHKTELAEMLQHRLEKSGYDVVVTNNGFGAIRLTKKFLPSVVVMAVGLPFVDGDGREVVRVLRANYTTSNVRIVMLSDNDGGRSIDNAMKSGADICLIRPVAVAALLGSIDRLIQSPQAPESASPSPQPVTSFDLTYVAGWLDSDLSEIQDHVCRFLHTSGNRLEALRHAVDARDDETAKNIAHQLRGALTNLGASPAAQRARDLEGEGEDKLLQFQSLEVAMDTLTSELRTWLDASYRESQ